jgi:hypothetical protein
MAKVKETIDGINIEYIDSIPDIIPEGKRLVHSVLWMGKELGEIGFRAWLAEPDDEQQILCQCGWASELLRHYKIRRQGE